VPKLESLPWLNFSKIFYIIYIENEGRN